MALELRPNCEYCDMDLPNGSPEAMMCSYECTFCRTCVETILHNVCPNCGGGFVERPIRPKTARRADTSLEKQPASDKRRYTKYTREELEAFCATARDIPPDER